MPIDVRLAGAERTPDLAALMGRAFARDPLIVWPFRGHADADEGLAFATFSILLPHYAHAGVLWETTDGNGCAAWIPPGELEIFETMDLATRPPIGELTDDGGARYDAMWDWLGSHIPDEPVWFLDCVGVDPASHGVGRGRTLVDIGVRPAREVGVPAFCETSSEANVRFYEHLGFHVAGQGDAPGGGPHVWFMLLDHR